MSASEYKGQEAMSTRDITRHNLLVRVARLYYLGHLNHREIAAREGLSRIKVTRLLQEAEKDAIIEFRISDPMVGTLELEERIQKSFGLRRAIITPTPRKDDDLYDVLGRFAADFLSRALRESFVIGISWGRTLNGMLPYLEHQSFRNLHVVSLSGGLAANRRQPNPYDIASSVAKRLGASAHYPLIPAIVEAPSTRRLLMKEQRMKPILKLWQNLDIALVSVGVIGPETGLYYSFPDPKTEAARVRALGAVGDILARPFDIQGRPVDAGFNDRMIAVKPADLHRAGTVVGIAGGSQKIQPILGALRTGQLTTLITDERTAERVLSLAEKSGKCAEIKIARKPRTT
jgi:DNA-binding transcriptional regulator LsrR (DeoR family)